MRHGYPLSGWVTFMGLVLSAGCSRDVPTYPVRGHVVYADGAPVKDAVVEMESTQADPKDRRNYSARLDAEGRFQLQAREGEYRAIVVPAAEPMGTVQGSGVPPHVERRFMAYETSGLRVTVTSDPAKNEVKLVVERPDAPQGP